MNFVLRIVLSDSDSKKKMENCYAHAQSWFRVLVIKNSLIQIKPILTKLICLLFMSISIKSIYHNSRMRKVMWSQQTKFRKFKTVLYRHPTTIWFPIIKFTKVLCMNTY